MNATNVTAAVERLSSIGDRSAFGVPNPVAIGIFGLIAVFLVLFIIVFAWSVYRGYKKGG